jgi:hypothetical protein
MADKTITRPDRTSEKLREAARSVEYEVGMLHQIPVLWGFLPLLDTTFRNMAIESFLVHFRNLRDFLFPTTKAKQDPDNVIGTDFDPTGWSQDSEGWQEVVADERDRINRQLSHISYSRQDYESQWPVAKMREAIESRFTEFIRGLPTEKRKMFERLQPIFPEEFH